MAKIKEIRAREILDSRGWPTVEADIRLDDGILGRASVPSGASTGNFEAVELRDGEKGRYLGRGVLRAVANVCEVIGPKVRGLEAGRQKDLDSLLRDLDGTPDKSRLGANALLAVSLAFARASADSKKVPLYRWIAELTGSSGNLLPVPLLNLINGGRHADNNIDIQEFMILPRGTSFREGLRMGAEVFQHLRRILSQKNLSTAVGDEGGFAPHLESNRQILGILSEAASKAGHPPGKGIVLGLDVAASEFFVKGEYRLRTEEGTKKTAEDLIDYYRKLSQEFPLVSLEDGLSEEDWEGWTLMTRRLGKILQLVGDDLFTTNPERLERGIKGGAANAVLIKPNQIGTLSETLETIRKAREAGYRTVVSHRSGETEDTFIADLVVGTNAGQIKAGSLSRSERLVKYNRLLRIEEELGREAEYAGEDLHGSR